jgi:RNA polymerase sigma-70 factor (ECF subfamily)
MDERAREELESRMRALCVAADFDGAATLAVRGYGPEVFGFLVGVYRDETEASDVFAEVAEAIWKGLPTFAWGSSLRTWAYAIARNVTRTRRRDAARRTRRAPRAGESALDGVAQVVRTETLAFLRTEKRTRLQALRDALPEEDRMLLILRVDRQLAWNELARILGDAEGRDSLDDGGVTREAARLRKRFQLVKERLRELAKKEGLIE